MHNKYLLQIQELYVTRQILKVKVEASIYAQVHASGIALQEKTIPTRRGLMRSPRKAIEGVRSSGFMSKQDRSLSLNLLFI